AAVFNLGSSAVDGVYVLPGKKLILRSKPLGGHQIDRGILRKAARDNGLQLTSLSVYREAYLLSQVRALKEAYYRTGEPTEGILYLTPEKTREYCRVRLTREWMQEVLTAEPVPCSDGQNSWCTELKAFFEEMYAAIGDRPCRAVVLTGGTSHVFEVMAAAQSVFGDIVKRADDPKTAVALGLSQSKNQAETDFPAEEIGRDYYRMYIMCLLEYVEEVAYREMLCIMEGSLQHPSDRDFVKRLTPSLDQVWDSAGHIQWIREITERFTWVNRNYTIKEIDLGNRCITMRFGEHWDWDYERESFRHLAGVKLRSVAGHLYRHLMYHGNEETELQKLIYGPGGVQDYREAAKKKVAQNIEWEENRFSELFTRHFTACVDPHLISDQIKRICPPKLLAERFVIGDRRQGISGLWSKHRKKESLYDMLCRDNDLKNYFHAAAKTAYEMSVGQIFLLLFEEEVDLQ
ncbi:MAG: hypothetical protein IKU62_03220, partial [Ruminiclostridium sp.]|nr:hypothetical protein [Ruminiclostridium sp.]